MPKLTHVNRRGETQMVDISPKPVTRRKARAAGRVRLTAAIAAHIQADNVAKGNVFEVARIAAIQAAKRTWELIPLCHPIPIGKIELRIWLDGQVLQIHAEVVSDARTGVEMEALTAVSVAALTVYDMCKSIDKGMIIEAVELLEKEGGKSGIFRKKSRS